MLKTACKIPNIDNHITEKKKKLSQKMKIINLMEIHVAICNFMNTYVNIHICFYEALTTVPLTCCSRMWPVNIV